MNSDGRIESIKTLIKRVDNRPGMYMEALSGHDITDELWESPKMKPDSNFMEAVKELWSEGNYEAIAQTLAHFHALATHYEELVDLLEKEVGIVPEADDDNPTPTSNAAKYTGQLRGRWWEVLDRIDISQMRDLFKSLDPFQMIVKLLENVDIDYDETSALHCEIYSDGSGAWGHNTHTGERDEEHHSDFDKTEDALDAYLNWIADL